MINVRLVVTHLGRLVVVHHLTANRTLSRNHTQLYNEAFPPAQILFIIMPNYQPWTRVSRDFQRNPRIARRSIVQVLELVLRSHSLRRIYKIYNHILELFTHGPVLPNCLHVIYEHFHRNNVYRIRYTSLFAYYHFDRFAPRIFETLARKAPQLYRAAVSQMVMETVRM
jgi:hypothetical protein